MLKLSTKEITYERKWELEDEPEDLWPVFVLRKLTSLQVEAIDDQVTVATGKAIVSFKGGTARRLKLDAALVDWRNVQDENGNVLPFTSAMRKLLPTEIQLWLVDVIDDMNGLKGMEEKERKNS